MHISSHRLKGNLKTKFPAHDAWETFQKQVRQLSKLSKHKISHIGFKKKN